MEQKMALGVAVLAFSGLFLAGCAGDASPAGHDDPVVVSPGSGGVQSYSAEPSLFPEPKSTQARPSTTGSVGMPRPTPTSPRAPRPSQPPPNTGRGYSPAVPGPDYSYTWETTDSWETSGPACASETPDTSTASDEPTDAGADPEC